MEQIKIYFKRHWTAMLFGAIPATLMVIIGLINLIVAYRVDNAKLVNKVDAQTTAVNNIVQIHQEILNRLTVVEQKEKDNHDLLVPIYDKLLK